MGVSTFLKIVVTIVINLSYTNAAGICSHGRCSGDQLHSGLHDICVGEVTQTAYRGKFSLLLLHLKIRFLSG